VIDRRTRFFLVAAVVSFAVTPLGLEQYREIALGVGALYLVFALMSFLDHLGKRR
jgi:hypothetical protein